MDFHGFNTLDFIIIGSVALSGLLALMRGFVREMFSLVAWGGAYEIAMHFYPLAKPLVGHYLKNEKAVEWAAIALVFMAGLALLIVLGNVIIYYAIRGKTITLIDQSLGFVYGLIRGIVLVALIYMVLVMILWPDIDKPASETKTESVQNTGDKPAEGEAKAADKNPNTPPELLVKAKTRPLMASIGRTLEEFVPKEMIDKHLKEYVDPKGGAKKDLDQKALDMMTTPAPQAPAKPTP